MNRVVLLGVAVFLAVVGIGLLGSGVDSALAGHGCCGCCGGCYGCHGCYGGGCCGCYGGGCCGCYGGYDGHAGHGHGHAYYGYGQGGYAAAPAPVAAAAPVVAKRSFQRQPVYVRRIAFRR